MLTALKKLLWLLILSTGPLCSQQINDVVARQHDNYTVKIEYTLNGIQEQSIAAYYRAQSGSKFLGPLTALSGDTGAVSPGRHMLFWKPLQEPGIDAINDELVFKVELKGQAKPSLAKTWFCGDVLTDIEGNTYKTVKIGNQCWMAENLKTSKYQDKSVIPNITTAPEWHNKGVLRSHASCYNNNRSVHDDP